MSELKIVGRDAIFRLEADRLHFEPAVLVKKGSMLDREHGPAIIKLIGSGFMAMSLLEAIAFPYSSPVVIYKRGKVSGEYVKYSALIGGQIEKYVNKNKRIKKDVISLLGACQT